MDNDLIENYRGLYEHRIGYGSRPAIIVIDFVRAYTTVGAAFFGQGVVDAVAETTELLDTARQAGVPIIHTRPMYHPSGVDGGLFVKKIPALRGMVRGAVLGEFDVKVAPDPADLVFEKTYPSSFFATPMASTLTALGVDTIILAGCSTSGCVRATAVDGIQYGYRVIVPRECVGDRHRAPHDAALFDINAKYGDVETKADVLAYLRKIGNQARNAA
ncbi:isochorismatase family protein [Acidisphaera sp. L21]|uniref:isochorismatase family protein n=1 Tax=Acidisphaera sp. L21 TaxID=1641851 RepID=UPI00131B7F2D|nr:isochorismatase family protein [Acidisphaera sp. L21]